MQERKGGVGGGLNVISITFNNGSNNESGVDCSDIPVNNYHLTLQFQKIN